MCYRRVCGSTPGDWDANNLVLAISLRRCRTTAYTSSAVPRFTNMLLSPRPFGSRSVVRLGVIGPELRPPLVAIPSVRDTAHTFTAHGSTPVGHFVSGHCSPPSLWYIPQGSHAGTWVTGRANRLWAFAMWSGFPGLGLLCPHRHSLGPRRFATRLRSAISRSPSHPVGSFPCSRSWTPATSDRWRLPDIPSALCGSPPRHRVPQVDLWRPFPPSCKSGSTASSVRGPRNALAVLIDKGGQGTSYP